MSRYILGAGWAESDLDRVRRALNWVASEYNYTRIAQAMRAVSDRGVAGLVDYIKDSLDQLDEIDAQALVVPKSPTADATEDSRLIRRIDVIEYEPSNESNAAFDRKIAQLRSEHQQRVADSLFLKREPARGSSSAFRLARG